MTKIQFKIRDIYVEYKRENKYILFCLETPVVFEGKLISYVRVNDNGLTEGQANTIKSGYKVGETVEITGINLSQTNINQPDQSGNLILYEGATGGINRSPQIEKQTKVLS